MLIKGNDKNEKTYFYGNKWKRANMKKKRETIQTKHGTHRLFC